MKTDKILATGK